MAITRLIVKARRSGAEQVSLSRAGRGWGGGGGGCLISDAWPLPPLVSQGVSLGATLHVLSRRLDTDLLVSLYYPCPRVPTQLYQASTLGLAAATASGQVMACLRGHVTNGPVLQLASDTDDVEAVSGVHLAQLSAASLAAHLLHFADAATRGIRYPHATQTHIS